MIALLPEEMIIKSDDDLVMDFQVNSESPVNVQYRPWDDGKSHESDEIVFLQGKYFVVTATVDKYNEKRLAFENDLGTINIPEIENKFSEIAKIRWETEKKEKYDFSY